VYLYNPSADLPDPIGDGPDQVTAGDLNRWEMLDDQMSVDAAANMSLAVVNVDAKLKSLAVVRDWSAYVRRTVEGRERDYGYGVRLVVTVSAVTLDGDLRLPAIAAKAHLGMVRASANMSVIGYNHPEVGGLLPPFSDLNVEGYGKYTKAADDIRVFIAAHPDGVAPVMLRELPEKFDEGDLPAAVGTARALRMIADGRTLARALEAAPEWPEYVAAIRATYAALHVGPDEAPDRGVRDDADAWLNWTS